MAEVDNTPSAAARLAVEATGVGRRYDLGRWLRPLGQRSSAPGRGGQALVSVDLELPRGASLGLVGPNGSGKSTLLRLLSGVERPSHGRLRVLGSKTSESEVRRRVGYLPEDSPFPRELSARATLELLGALDGVGRRERKRMAAEWLVRVDLDRSARVPLGRYSRGMLRRFGLAQACMLAPELLLLDEPTAGLDAPGYDVLDELLREARARGAALVIASHVADDIVDHCERALLLLEGRVASAGTPRELLFDGERRIGLGELYRRHAR